MIILNLQLIVFIVCMDPLTTAVLMCTAKNSSAKCGRLDDFGLDVRDGVRGKYQFDFMILITSFVITEFFSHHTLDSFLQLLRTLPYIPCCWSVTRRFLPCILLSIQVNLFLMSLVNVIFRLALRKDPSHSCVPIHIRLSICQFLCLFLLYSG